MSLGGVHQPIEQGRILRSRVAVEVIDAVTFERVSDGVTVTVTGIETEPKVNSGGIFVWLLPVNGMPIPTEVSVDPGTLPLQGVKKMAIAPVAADETAVMHIVLPPTRAYPFSGGLTVVRAGLIHDPNDNPLQRLADVPVSLQWIDDTQPGTVWMDTPTISGTDANGDFAAILRLSANQNPRLDANGSIQVRLAATYLAQRKFSLPLPIPQGRVADPIAPKIPPNDKATDPFLPFFRWTQFTAI